MNEELECTCGKDELYGSLHYPHGKFCLKNRDIQNKPSITAKKIMTIQQVKDTYGNPDIQVAPGIYQSLEDYEANMRFDEARDNELQDQENINS